MEWTTTAKAILSHGLATPKINGPMTMATASAAISKLVEYALNSWDIAELYPINADANHGALNVKKVLMQSPSSWHDGISNQEYKCGSAGDRSSYRVRPVLSEPMTIHLSNIGRFTFSRSTI